MLQARQRSVPRSSRALSQCCGGVAVHAAGSAPSCGRAVCVCHGAFMRGPPAPCGGLRRCRVPRVENARSHQETMTPGAMRAELPARLLHSPRQDAVGGGESVSLAHPQGGVRATHVIGVGR